MKELLERSGHELARIILEHQNEIEKAYLADEKNLKIGLGLTISPGKEPDSYQGEVSINFVTSRVKDKIPFMISPQLEFTFGHISAAEIIEQIMAMRSARGSVYRSGPTWETACRRPQDNGFACFKCAWMQHRNYPRRGERIPRITGGFKCIRPEGICEKVV